MNEAVGSRVAERAFLSRCCTFSQKVEEREGNGQAVCILNLPDATLHDNGLDGRRCRVCVQRSLHVEVVNNRVVHRSGLVGSCCACCLHALKASEYRVTDSLLLNSGQHWTETELGMLQV